MRTCTKCRIAKPHGEFFRDRSKKHGLQARCKPCKLASVRDYMRRTDGHRRRYARLRDSERERHTIRKYGVSLSDYQRMLADQRGACAICLRLATRTLDIDHDHATGTVRGLLCTSCNRMLGHAGDSAQRLRAGAAYLEASSRRSQRSSSPRTRKP